MLLAIDIGNTNIKIALFRGRRILYCWRLVTDKYERLEGYQKRLARLFAQQKIKPQQIERVIICSVVPKITQIFKKVLSILFKRQVYTLGENALAPIKNLYRRPKQVGQDRLINAWAAFRKYGGPAIVVDFGTAVTFDAVSARGSYLGGVIVPGVEVALKALIDQAELLPRINLGKPGALLGRETKASMKSGIVYGYSYLTEGILGALKKKLKPKPLVIATGGVAALISAYCPSINKVDAHLTLDGLRLMDEKLRCKVKIDKKQ